jgi:ABC-type transport system involved in multi-copper enzyme maturation permease subunit
MTKTTLILFWVIWHLDVLMTLFGYREFISGVFGRYAAPSTKYVMLWVALFGAALLIIGGSLYFKNQGQATTAMSIVATPLVLALPYVLWLAVVLFSGKSTNWR